MPCILYHHKKLLQLEHFPPWIHDTQPQPAYLCHGQSSSSRLWTPSPTLYCLYHSFAFFFLQYLLWTTGPPDSYNSSTMQKIWKHFQDWPLFQLHALISIYLQVISFTEEDWTLPWRIPEVLLGSKGEGKGLISGCMVKTSVADLQTLLLLAELFITCQMISSMATYWAQNESKLHKGPSLSPAYLSRLISCHFAVKVCSQTMLPLSITGFEKEVKKNVFFP